MIARYVPPSSWTPPYIVLAALLILGLPARAPVAHGQAGLEGVHFEACLPVRHGGTSGAKAEDQESSKNDVRRSPG